MSKMISHQQVEATDEKERDFFAKAELNLYLQVACIILIFSLFYKFGFN